MRYFWTIFWAFLLSNMIVYVISSMQATGFSFAQAIILAAVFSVVIFILGDGVVSKESEQ